MAFLGFGKKDNKEEVKKDAQKSAPNKSVKKVAPKKESKKENKKETKAKPKTSTPQGRTDYSGVLIQPRITEKAAVIAEEGNVYTFNVHPDSTKKEIAKAVEAVYKVKPIKVNIAQVKRKRVLRRGKRGMTAGGKKAMVYLRSGDKIEFV